MSSSLWRVINELTYTAILERKFTIIYSSIQKN